MIILFYIKAKVSYSIFGISGESQQGVSVLVRAANANMAKSKFEEYCREKYKHTGFESMRFEYLEIAPEIQ